MIVMVLLSRDANKEHHSYPVQCLLLCEVINYTHNMCLHETACGLEVKVQYSSYTVTHMHTLS